MSNLVSWISYSFLGNIVDISVAFNTKRRASIENQTLPLYDHNERVDGEIVVALREGKHISHHGLQAELLGVVEFVDKSKPPYKFLTQALELESAGQILATRHYQFAFANVEKQFETYNGAHVKLRYLIRAIIQRKSRVKSDLVQESEFVVQILGEPPKPNMLVPLRMEVGIEDILHIEFEYNKNVYHLEDIVLGRVRFNLVRIRLKRMELAIIRRETIGSVNAAGVVLNETDTIAKFELMDGSPVKGEHVPVKLHLVPYNLAPTLFNVHNKFSVRYFLNLVLLDEEDRRYFKQQELTLWRYQTRSIETP